MKGDGLLRICAKMFYRGAIFVGREKLCGWIWSWKTKRFKRTRQLERSVFAVVELCRAGKKILDAGFSNVLFEDPIRIVEITDDQVEACEIFAEFRGQVGVPREKSGQRSRVERANAVRIEASFGERDDGLGAENFKMCARETIAKQFDRGQGEDEIADRAAADDEDPVQINNA
jgi:hypothetical protein